MFNVGSTCDIFWHDQSSRPGLFRNLLQFLLASCCEYELMTLDPSCLAKAAPIPLLAPVITVTSFVMIELPESHEANKMLESEILF